MMLPALLLAVAACAAGSQGEKATISSDITVRSKAAGPSLSVPPPAPSKPVVDEVLGSLSLGRGSAGPGVETIHVSLEGSRLERPFPESPFLALSPENIRARYDSWAFEVLDAEGIVWRTEGVGLLNEKVDWDGAGVDGRLALVAGQSYRYRFTGQRGGRAFRIESDPAALKSFTHREYVGETRLEVSASEIFAAGTNTFTPGADRFLNAMAERLRTSENRSDGTYKLELYTQDPRGKLAKARSKALAKKLSASLLVAVERVVVTPLPVERGEALAAFLAPSKGARFRRE